MGHLFGASIPLAFELPAIDLIAFTCQKPNNPWVPTLMLLSLRVPFLSFHTPSFLGFGSLRQRKGPPLPPVRKVSNGRPCFELE